MESDPETKESNLVQTCFRDVPEWRLERSFYKAVNLKSKLPWKIQAIRDVRVMGELLRKAAKG